MAGNESQEVLLQPVVATPFTHLDASIGGGAAQRLTIEQSVALVGKQWLPWAGAPEQPPTIDAEAGIQLYPAAQTTAIDANVAFGPAVHGAQAMRVASLGVVSATITECKHLADFVAGVIGKDISRPLCVALSSIIPAAAATDGPMLAAARTAAPAFFSSFIASLDALPSHHIAVATANTQLATLGVTITNYQAGRHFGQALAAAEAAAIVVPPPPPPLLGAPHPAVADPAIAAAVAAAMGGGPPPPDPFEVEARRRVLASIASSSSPPLDSAQQATAVAHVVAALRASGWGPTPPPAGGGGSARPPPPSPPIATEFAGLRIAGAELSPSVEIVANIASAFGKSELELATTIAAAAGKPAPDAFFASDAEGLAARAAAHWAIIAGCHGYLIPTLTATWLRDGFRQLQSEVILGFVNCDPEPAAGARWASAALVRARTLPVLSERGRDRGLCVWRRA